MVRPCARRESAWGDLVTTAPPSTSPWPARYLETLWTLKWAPNSSGRARRGVANVLSTTSAAPAWLAMAATESISATRSLRHEQENQQAHGLLIGRIKSNWLSQLEYRRHGGLETLD